MANNVAFRHYKIALYEEGRGLRQARIHYSNPRVPNRRPLCLLGVRSWPLSTGTFIVTNETEHVTCRRCLKSLEPSDG